MQILYPQTAFATFIFSTGFFFLLIGFPDGSRHWDQAGNTRYEPTLRVENQQSQKHTVLFADPGGIARDVTRGFGPTWVVNE